MSPCDGVCNSYGAHIISVKVPDKDGNVEVRRVRQVEEMLHGDPLQAAPSRIVVS